LIIFKLYAALFLRIRAHYLHGAKFENRPLSCSLYSFFMFTQTARILNEKNQPRHMLIDWLASFCITRYTVYAAADADPVHTVRRNFPTMMKVPQGRVTPLLFHP